MDDSEKERLDARRQEMTVDKFFGVTLVTHESVMFTDDEISHVLFEAVEKKIESLGINEHDPIRGPFRIDVETIKIKHTPPDPTQN